MRGFLSNVSYSVQLVQCGLRPAISSRFSYSYLLHFQHLSWMGRFGYVLTIYTTRPPKQSKITVSNCSSCLRFSRLPIIFLRPLPEKNCSNRGTHVLDGQYAYHSCLNNDQTAVWESRFTAYSPTMTHRYHLQRHQLDSTQFSRSE
jgi:hypothetical protein